MRQDITEIVVHSLRGPQQSGLAVPQAGPNALDAERAASPDPSHAPALRKGVVRRAQRSAPKPPAASSVRAPSGHTPEKPVPPAGVQEDPCPLLNTDDEVFTDSKSAISPAVQRVTASVSAPTQALPAAVGPKVLARTPPAAAGAASATGATSADSADPTEPDLSLDTAMSYYLASDEVKKLQIQIGGLTSMWVVGCLSLPLSVLLVMVRVFFYYLEVQTNVDVTEKSVLQGASSEAEPAAEDPDAPVMQKTQIGVQRSARPRAQRSAPPGTAGATPAGRDGELSDVGIIFSPVPKGLKITGLKPGTNAADSELAKGDTVFMIDEQFTAGISMSDAIAALCGPSQSPVDLTARRESNKGPPSKVYATILRDSPHNPTEWLARWNAASEASKFNLAKIFEPLSAAARACMDVATGKVPVRSLFNKVRGVVALGTSSVQNSISPDAKLATAKKRREAAHAAQKMSMQEAVRVNVVCVCVGGGGRARARA